MNTWQKERQVDIGYLFDVQVIGLPPLGQFMEVENIGRKFEPYSYYEGGRNEGPHLFYDKASYGEIVLKWGMMDRLGLWSWIEQVQIGAPFRKSGKILQYPRVAGAQPLRTYSFFGAWPVEWKGPGLNSNESKIPIEELRLVCNYLSITAGPVETPLPYR